ncbi:MAG: glycosyltransferase family 4 protein [Chloroflexota bacterium]
MRVGINAWFLHQDTTGSGQYLRALLAEFVASSHAYTLLTSPAQPGDAPPLDLPPSRFHQVALDSPFDPSSPNLTKLWFEQVAVPRAARRLSLDLLHVPYWGSPLRPTVPTVVTVHDIIPLLLPAYRGGPLVRAYTRLVALAARRCDRVLTDSFASQRDIVRRLGIRQERVQAVHLAPDSRFRAAVDAAALAAVRRKHGLPERYLLYLGGFDRRKNVPVILQAFARLLAQHDAARLVVAGRLPGKDSAFFPDPRRFVRELNLGQAVHLTGWLPDEDKPALYTGALALVFPSRYEGFGLPPLEAMACGTPVIASTAASLPEVVGEGGLLVPPDDVDALAQAMARLWQDGSLRQVLGRRAWAHAAQFCWAKAARETLAAYDMVVACKTPC